MKLLKSIIPENTYTLPHVQEELKKDNEKADKLILKFVFVHLLVSLTLTPIVFGNTLTNIIIAAIFGGLATVNATIAYKFYKGTVISRLLLATSLLIFTLIFIQQSFGKIECHFHLWIVLGILIRYKDSFPIFFTTSLIILHHITLNYCQQFGLTLFGEPVRVFEFTSGWDVVLLHTAFVAPSAIIYAILVANNTEKFIEQVDLHLKLDEQNKIIQEKNSKVLAQNEELRLTTEELAASNGRLTETKQQLEKAFTEVQQAQEEAAKLAIVAESTHSCVLITDVDGYIEYANQAFTKLTGYTFDEVKGKKPGSVLQGEHTNPATVQLIREKLANQESFNTEIINYSKSGEEYWVSLSISPVMNQEGQLINFVGIQSDISHQKAAERKLKHDKLDAENAFLDLKNAQSQLVQSEKMSSLGQLTAGIAHEINNPINFVYAGVDTLNGVIDDLYQVMDNYKLLHPNLSQHELVEKLQELDQLKSSVHFDELQEDITDLLADISEGAKRTQSIVSSLRTFSRLGEKGMKKVDLHENLESTLVILNPKLRDRITVEKEYDPHFPTVDCNIGQINQVFMNLLSNAADAIEGSGKIHIKTWQANRHVYIRISDTGKGIAQEHLDKIFEPFFTTKDVGKGTGLGLAISHGVIEQHLGEIEVSSEINKGTSFTVILPIEQEKLDIPTT